MTSTQWHKLHRRIGILIMVFIPLLAATGILLNHTNRFGLHDSYVQNKWLQDWYEIDPKQPSTTFKIDEAWITRIGDRIYFNKKELLQKSETLLGAVKSKEIIIVALKQKLLLLTEQGELIEKLSDSEGVPAGMKSIGLDTESRLTIEAAHGYYLADVDSLEWEEHDDIDARWTIAVEPPEKLYKQLLELYRGKGLNLERVILDLHSGRILGDVGVYLVDVVAITFILLALTGGWMWLSRKIQ